MEQSRGDFLTTKLGSIGNKYAIFNAPENIIYARLDFDKYRESNGKEIVYGYNYKDVYKEFVRSFPNILIDEYTDMNIYSKSKETTFDLAKRKNFIVNNVNNIVILLNEVPKEYMATITGFIMLNSVQNFLVNWYDFSHYIHLIDRSNASHITFKRYTGEVVIDNELSDNVFTEDENPDIEFIVLDQTPKNTYKGEYHKVINRHICRRDCNGLITIILYKGTEAQFKKEIEYMNYMSRDLRYFNFDYFSNSNSGTTNTNNESKEDSGSSSKKEPTGVVDSLENIEIRTNKSINKYSRYVSDGTRVRRKNKYCREV